MARYCVPLREGQQELTKEVWPFSFFTLVPVLQSHTAAVLSMDAENRLLGVYVGRGGGGGGGVSVYMYM